MKGLDQKLTAQLRKFVESITDDELFDVLVDEVEKAYYADWRQSTDVQSRENAWNEYHGFKRMVGTFRNLSMAQKLADKRTGDGNK